MRPVLFRLGRWAVPSYPAMLYVGLVAGVLAADIAAHHSRMNPFLTYVGILILLVPALIGARLLFVLLHWDGYRNQLSRIWDRGEGGFSMYGGLAPALLISIPVLRTMHMEVGAFWDAATFTILVGMIFTRAGCLMNGCCSGQASDAWFAMRLPNSAGIWERRIPTQIMEQLWAVTLLVMSVVIWDRLPFRGALFLLVATSYSSLRFLVEFSREQGARRRLNVNHWISLGIMISSVSVLSRYWRG